MSRYKSKSNQKKLGLLNFEGDLFIAYKESETKYVIVDDIREVILTTDADGLRNVLSGKVSLMTSHGRAYNIPAEHPDARPSQSQIDKFLGTPGTVEVDLELWESCKYRIREEGIDYCFESYSHWEEIEDKEFHRLRKEFLRTMKELRNYIDNKVEEGRQRELDGE